MSTISSDFSNKYSYGPIKLDRDVETLMLEKAWLQRPSLEERNEMYWSGISNITTNTQRNTNDVFSSSEVHNQGSYGLNSSEIDKVDIITRVQSDSKAVNSIINNNITAGVREVFGRFGVSADVSSAIKSYQENEPLAEVNSLVSQGINELQKNGSDSETLDKFLYQLSLAIDEKVTQSMDELAKIPALADQVSRQEKTSIFQSDIPTLRVWQSKDLQETSVRQTFKITNQQGDQVEIYASYSHGQSITTDDYDSVSKRLNVTITEGSLSADEQKQFNQFLDDFASVSNEILEGDLEGANQAFSSLNAADYGFQSITKKDSSEQRTMDEDLVHTYNKELGHTLTSGGLITEKESSVVNNSYVKGGALHNVKRSNISDLANFNIKYANTHEQASSLIVKDLRYNGQQDRLFGSFEQYGKSADGFVLQNNQGELYRYQYNEENREASGWAKIDKNEVNYQALQGNQHFKSFKLNTDDSSNITLTHLPTNTVKDYGTSLASEPTDKQYSDKYDGQVFEDKAGNLYQYQFNGDYQSSGWLKVEKTDELQQLFQERFEKEGYMHNYLNIDVLTQSARFASLLNGGEHLSASSNNINMQILQADNR